MNEAENEFEIPKSGQMRMPDEVWNYCNEIAKRNGFKNATEAAKKIIIAHRGWMVLDSSNPRIY